MLLFTTFFATIIVSSKCATNYDAEKELGISSDSMNFVRNRRILFIGGVPRSGTTLMRAMLDAHPDIRCGEESMVIHRVLENAKNWTEKYPRYRSEMREAFDDAMSSFIYQIVLHNGPPAPLLCDKDPFTGYYFKYLHELFPNVRFILMIRDGRAVVHSIVERSIPLPTFDKNDKEQMLRRWNRIMSRMLDQCEAEFCLKVFYEELVQKPRQTMEKILSFLNISWDDSVLHHEDFVGNQIELNPREFSAGQVKSPINTDPLTSWFDFYPKEICESLDEICPNLKNLGYDTSTCYPSYREQYFAG